MEEKKNDYLSHHGIRGQKWGIRRYQNSDGSLTDEGKKRYLDSEGDFHTPYKKNIFGKKRYSEEDQEVARNYGTYVEKVEIPKEYNRIRKMKKGSKERIQAEQDFLESTTGHNPTVKGSSRYGYLANKVWDSSSDDFKSKEMRDINAKRDKAYDEVRTRKNDIYQKYSNLPHKERWDKYFNDLNNDPVYKKVRN